MYQKFLTTKNIEEKNKNIFMIFIGLDVSKISTALCIEKNNKVKLFNYTTKKDNNVWVKDTTPFINYRHINYNYSDEKDYSKSEMIKLDEFDQITDLIIDDIFDSIKVLDSVKIGIEGYAYKAKGPIFDLIEYTTFLKYKLISKMGKFSTIQIISPLTLKNECCKMVYKPRIELKGKKIIKEIPHYENNNGKSSNNFDKWDMFFAFIESNIDMELKKWCKEYLTEISKNKDVFKPLDDIIDSIFLKEMMKRNNE